MFIRQQKIAAELGKPATAFVAPLSAAEGGFESGDRFGISWHSPVTELPLCGHGTLAAAAVIFEEYGNRAQIQQLFFSHKWSKMILASIYILNIVSTGSIRSGPNRPAASIGR